MRTLVRRWSLFLLPALAACGLTDVLEPDVSVVDGDSPAVREYEDGVMSVDMAERSLTLTDGTVVNLVDDTDFKADPYGRVHELATVYAALEAEVAVRAWGKGEVAQSDPPILQALSAGFEIERPLQEFEGHVVSVDLEEGLFALEDGMTVRLDEHTERKADQHGNLHELAAVHEALEAGLSVVAWGAGEASLAYPDALDALRVGFEIEERRVEEFEGVVAQVHPAYGSFLLEDGTLVRVTDRTDVALNTGLVVTLAAMHVAVEAGIRVFASGVAEVESDDPHVLQALRLEVQFGPDDPGVDPEPDPDPDPEPDPDLEQFEGRVDWVDSGILFLVGGTEVTVSASTEIVGGNDQSPASIDDLIAALEMGRMVTARGAGTVVSTSPLRIEAVRVEFEIQVVDFEADVDFVDEGAVFLVDGTFVLITESTVVAAADGQSPSDLGGVDLALQAGDRVRAFGSAIVTAGGEDPDEPMNVEALSITFLRIPAS